MEKLAAGILRRGSTDMEASRNAGDLPVLIRAPEPASTNHENDPQRRQSSQEKRAARNSRVHFGDFEDLNNELISAHDTQPLTAKLVKEEHIKTFTLSLGFLQEAHKYEVKFYIPLEEIKLSTSSSCVAVAASESRAAAAGGDEELKVVHPPNNSSLKSISRVLDEPSGAGTGTRLEILMEVDIVDADASFEDRFTLRFESLDNYLISIKLSAQVLGKGKGTPSLKLGIKCLGLLGRISPSEDCSSSPLSPGDSNATAELGIKSS